MYSSDDHACILHPWGHRWYGHHYRDDACVKVGTIGSKVPLNGSDILKQQ